MQFRPPARFGARSIPPGFSGGCPPALAGCGRGRRARRLLRLAFPGAYGACRALAVGRQATAASAAAAPAPAGLLHARTAPHAAAWGEPRGSGSVQPGVSVHRQPLPPPPVWGASGKSLPQKEDVTERLCSCQVSSMTFLIWDRKAQCGAAPSKGFWARPKPWYTHLSTTSPALIFKAE